MGGVYFVTDGEPVVWREFLTELVGTQGVSIPDKSVPARLAAPAAVLAEWLWRLKWARARAGPRRSDPSKRPGSPPLTRLAVWLSSQECTLDTSRARAELGYEPRKTRAEGLAELSSGS